MLRIVSKSACWNTAVATEIDRDSLVLGLYGVRVDPEHALESGDRVEICRPLKTDPRDLRRALVAGGRVMGGGAEGTTASKKARK